MRRFTCSQRIVWVDRSLMHIVTSKSRGELAISACVESTRSLQFVSSLRNRCVATYNEMRELPCIYDRLQNLSSCSHHGLNPSDLVNNKTTAITWVCVLAELEVGSQIYVISSSSHRSASWIRVLSTQLLLICYQELTRII